MPISGSDLALMPARLAVMRLGASRLGYYQPVFAARVNGVARNASNVRLDGLSIRDELDSIPNTATMRVQGFVPVQGQDVHLYLGDTQPTHLIFAGKILQATKTYDLIPAHLSYDLSCISWEWLLNRRKVTARYLSESATAIAIDLLDRFTDGFSAAGVQAGLETVDEITFTNEDMIDCLDRLANRIGGHWVVDYEQVLHFGTTIAPGGSSTARAISDSTPRGLIAIAATVDLSQVRTRVLVEGGGSTAATEVVAGETRLPLDDGSWYDQNGGTVVSGPQRITYTGVEAGGTGALVGTSPTPTNAPTVTLQAGTGIEPGAREYAITFGDGTGETAPGPTATVTIGGTLAAPTSGPTATKQLTGSLSAGAYYWATTNIDAEGRESGPSTASATITMDNVAGPATIPGALNENFGTNLDANAVYKYVYTFAQSGTGYQTAPSSERSITTFTPTPGGVYIDTGSDLATPPSGYIRLWYRTEGDGSVFKRLQGAGPDGFTSLVNAATAGTANDQFFDNEPDSSLGATLPASATAIYRSANISIPAASAPTAVARGLYRTAVGGSQLKKAATIAGTAATSYVDAIADGSLGANVPTGGAVYEQALLSDIALGPPGTTRREVYRTEAGDTQLKHLTTIADNTTETFLDDIADASLGADVPTSNTSGLTADDGQVNAGATTIPITASVPFPAAGGWALAGSVAIRHTGRTGATLTGVPASGPGALTATLNYGSEILALPMLIGIPASGDGSIQFTVGKGDDVNLLVTRNDLDAQAVMATLTGGDGIFEDYIQDRRLSQTEAEARGDARLAEVKDPEVRAQYTTRDNTTRSGRDVTITLTAPAISGTFKIQRTTIADLDPLMRLFPVRQVEASSRRFTLEQLLRLIKAA